MVLVSADGRYLFPRVINLSISSRENLLQVVRLEDFPRDGRLEAPILIVEFADFQCPPCRISGTVVKSAIQKKYGDKVVWVYKWLPSPAHSWAREAAIASACALEQSPSAFWNLHDFLLAQQAVISEDNLKPLLLNFALQGKLNTKTFDRCLRTKHSVETLLEISRAEARALGIRSTPTIYVNGKRALYPTDANYMQSLVEEEIRSRNPRQRE